jgi:hypothetical protein
MRTIFADSVYYLALLSQADAYHRLATELSRTVAGRILTTT